jgi:mRNA interferase RelE/StbE
VKITRTEHFKKAWSELTGEQKALSRKSIDTLVRDIGYPGLRVKKIKGTKDIFEARVSRTIRLTFQIDKGSILLRNIGQHDETIERP